MPNAAIRARNRVIVAMMATDLSRENMPVFSGFYKNLCALQTSACYEYIANVQPVVEFGEWI